jgi:acetyltransferase
VTLRPIKPEDEPAWHEMLAASSEESIRMRFRGLVRHASHRFATRFCFIDYDREMAIVAEVRGDSGSWLVGVGRIVTGSDRRVAEYALLVADPWQNRGLSQPLTERCLDVARAWGVDTVWAETDPENRRMISVLRRHGFTVSAKPEDGVMSASLDLRTSRGSNTASA